MCCDVTVLIVCDLTERSCLDRQHFKGLTWIGSSWLTEVFYNWKNERNKLKWINCYCLLHNTKVQREGKVQRLVTRHLETNQFTSHLLRFFFCSLYCTKTRSWVLAQKAAGEIFHWFFFPLLFCGISSVEPSISTTSSLTCKRPHGLKHTHTHTPYIIDVYLWPLYVSRYRIVSKCVMLSEVSVEN